MAMLPDVQHMEQIEACCVELLECGETLNVVEIATHLMELPELPMHCPYHHFLVPAALLTAACMQVKGDGSALSRSLKIARERASILPGGMCGQFGCCGAALGAGVFAAIWLETTPMSKQGWAAVNEYTSRCLSKVASVEGPRCCKRVTYLTLCAAAAAAKDLLGLDLGECPEITCGFYAKNRECRGVECPFFPK